MAVLAPSLIASLTSFIVPRLSVTGIKCIKATEVNEKWYKHGGIYESTATLIIHSTKNLNE